MSPSFASRSTPSAQDPVAPPELDLAFSFVCPAAVGADLAQALDAVGGLVDPGQGEELWTSLLRCWLAALASELPDPLRSDAYSLGLSLVDDAEIAALNADWRQRPEPTDVLAFAAQDEGLDHAPAMPSPSWIEADADDRCAAEPLELGDIVISLETAARQAPDHGHDLRRELLFLASHGLLHLLGWDHPDEARLAAMLARQEALLAAVTADGTRVAQSVV